MPTDVKERPILFSGPMVNAILDGSKTQTRRVVKPQPNPQHWQKIVCGFYSPTVIRRGLEEPGPEVFGIASEDEDWKCPYGQPGDELYVRESWAAHECYDDVPPREIPDNLGEAIWFSGPNGYGATEANGSSLRNNYMGRWRLSIHMPRWVSRITLEVTGVRVERVASISEYDAECELPEPDYRGVDAWAIGPCQTTRCPILAFEYLWDSINAKRGFGWDTNPFVWVVEFKLLEIANKGA